MLRLQAAEGAPVPPPVHVAVVAHAMAHLLVSMRVRTADLHGGGDVPAVVLAVKGRGLSGEVALAQLTVTRAVTTNLLSAMPAP